MDDLIMTHIGDLYEYIENYECKYNNTPQIDDLVIYKETGSLFLGRVIFTNVKDDYLKVEDLKVMRSIGEVQTYQSWSLYHSAIIKNFGNITLEEFEENYPEWMI